MVGDKFYNLNTGTWCVITDIKWDERYWDEMIVIKGNRYNREVELSLSGFEYYLSNPKVLKVTKDMFTIKAIPKHKFVY